MFYPVPIHDNYFKLTYFTSFLLFPIIPLFIVIGAAAAVGEQAIH